MATEKTDRQRQLEQAGASLRQDWWGRIASLSVLPAAPEALLADAMPEYRGLMGDLTRMHGAWIEALQAMGAVLDPNMPWHWNALCLGEDQVLGLENEEEIAVERGGKGKTVSPASRKESAASNPIAPANPSTAPKPFLPFEQQKQNPAVKTPLNAGASPAGNPESPAFDQPIQFQRLSDFAAFMKQGALDNDNTGAIPPAGKLSQPPSLQQAFQADFLSDFVDEQGKPLEAPAFAPHKQSPVQLPDEPEAQGQKQAVEEAESSQISFQRLSDFAAFVKQETPQAERIAKPQSLSNPKPLESQPRQENGSTQQVFSAQEASYHSPNIPHREAASFQHESHPGLSEQEIGFPSGKLAATSTLPDLQAQMEALLNPLQLKGAQNPQLESRPVQQGKPSKQALPRQQAQAQREAPLRSESLTQETVISPSGKLEMAPPKPLQLDLGLVQQPALAVPAPGLPTNPFLVEDLVDALTEQLQRDFKRIYGA